jgi:tetratricopeptide (TPR) repeat protein
MRIPYPDPRMLSQLAAAVVALAVAGHTLAAGDAPAKPSPRKQAAARMPSDEDLIGRTVFQALVGDLALQRGDTELGLSAWADLARRTRDPAVLERAVEVAANNRQVDLALELTRIWLQVDPDSTRARQAETSLLLLSNRVDELAPTLAQLLERDKANVAGNLMHLNRMLARHGDAKTIQRVIDRVAGPYADLPEAHFAMGTAAISADDLPRAAAEFRRSLELRPDWQIAALALAQTLARESRAEAIGSLEGFLVRYPESPEVRLALARLLIGERRYDDARVQYEKLLRENPDNPDILYPLAALRLQLGDTKGARPLLEKLLGTDFQDKSSVHFFLGQIDEDSKKMDAALGHYLQVTAGEQYIPARARAARILFAQGRADEARALLKSDRPGGAEHTQMVLAEAQMLREAGRSGEAYELLANALAASPDNPDLLYETALMAERQGKPEILEKHLRRLIEIKPDHAHGLNALGYSYADRNINLAEAYDLINRALALSPGDPFITDSLGWVLFRQGKREEALKVLESAYGTRADPEIAAHLGEVLWTLGRRQEAARLLKDAAKQFPDSEILAAALKKFAP